MAYTGFFVFGDSLVDAGNALKLAELYGDLTFSDLPDGAPAASLGYFNGRFSNGYSFADLVSNKYIGVTTKPVFPYGYEDPWLGVPIAPWASDPSGNNLNWAYGGAQIRRGSEAVPDFDGQTDAFRDAVDGDADPNALYLITMGGNDVRSLVPSGRDFVTQSEATEVLELAASKLGHEIGQLIEIGVTHIVVTGVPNVGLIPRYDIDGDGVLSGVEVTRSQQATIYSLQLDALIQAQLQELRTDYPAADIHYVSLFDAVEENIANLEALYGRPIDPVADAELLFFDQIHPNAQAHALLAGSIIDSMNGVTNNNRLPLTAPDYSATAAIAVQGEVDKVVVSLAANTSYTFEMLGISSLGTPSTLADPSLRILGPAGTLVGSNDDGGLGLDASFTFTTSTAGDYSIELSGVGSLTGSYAFQASGDAPGDNIYAVKSSATLILERAGEGTDTVNASVSYALGAGASIERLTTSSDRGKAAINLTGNELAQTIVGNAGSNVIDGKGGNDILTGGAGTDKFAFSSDLASNVDRISDFNVRDDTITLDDAIFQGLAIGALSSGAFAKGPSAGQADDRIIYDPASGNLYFDADGAGGAAQLHFATLGTKLGLTASDFLVV